MIRTYVVTHDYGFAPNPQGDFLTIACCKPVIRGTAKLGDWIVGSCPVNVDPQRLCFVAQVSNAATFDEYYRQQAQRRDAIYFRGPDSRFVQVKNAYHGESEVAHDTKVDRVLICSRFWYFGDHPVRLPDELALHLLKRGPGHRNCDDPAVAIKLERFVSNYPRGRQGSSRSKPKVTRQAPPGN